LKSTLSEKDNLMNSRLTFLFFVASFALFSCRNQGGELCPPHDNPYGLGVVHCIADYEAMVAENPDMELVDLELLIPGIALDIRYATPDNFTGEVIYTAPKAFLRRPVAEALKHVHDSLQKHNLALVIFDGYRPYAASVKFFEVYPDTLFVANPRYGSRHNRGCAVDVSLIDIYTGQVAAMPTDYDEFSEKAHPEYTDIPEEAINNRTLLFGIMNHFGFDHYPTEWWHFDFRGWDAYPLMDIPFELLIR